MLLRLIFWRLLLALPTLLGVLVIVFVLLRVAPGDPIAMMIAPGASAADIEQLRALYGLDRGLFAQFGIFLQEAFAGNFGVSITLKRDVLELVTERLPVTLELSLLALVAALTLGTGTALLAVRWRGGFIERVLDTVTGTVVAIPDFLWALAGILVFGVLLAVLPVFGLLSGELRFTPASGFHLLESLVRGRFDVTGSLLVHLLLPALALALPLAAMLARVLKASLLEAMAQDYILVARTRGYAPWRILIHEALRNAAIPALTLAGVQFTFLVGGTVLVEKIFGLPGIGSMAIDAVINRDLPLIQGVVLVFALLFMAVNAIVDLCNAWLDPRTGVGHGAAA